jgi:hypothetical protein
MMPILKLKNGSIELSYPCESALSAVRFAFSPWDEMQRKLHVFPHFGI